MFREGEKKEKKRFKIFCEIEKKFAPLQPLRKGVDVLKKVRKAAERQGEREKKNAAKNHQKIKKNIFWKIEKGFYLCNPERKGA